MAPTQSPTPLSLSEYPQSHLSDSLRLCMRAVDVVELLSTPRPRSAACWGFLWRSGTLDRTQDTADSPLSPPPATHTQPRQEP